MSDGEPSYKSLAMQNGGKIIHLIQYHNPKQLGQISIQKYEKVGPHYFHYIIYTHWRAFAKGTHELRFQWEIKFIKGRVAATRGRPRKTDPPKNTTQKWRQKIMDFQSGRMRRKGSAAVYVNCKNTKISLRKGSQKWMVRMLQPLFTIFTTKSIVIQFTLFPTFFTFLSLERFIQWTFA